MKKNRGAVKVPVFFQLIIFGIFFIVIGALYLQNKSSASTTIGRPITISSTTINCPAGYTCITPTFKCPPNAFCASPVYSTILVVSTTTLPSFTLCPLANSHKLDSGCPPLPIHTLPAISVTATSPAVSPTCYIGPACLYEKPQCEIAIPVNTHICPAPTIKIHNCEGNVFCTPTPTPLVCVGVCKILPISGVTTGVTSVRSWFGLFGAVFINVFVFFKL